MQYYSDKTYTAWILLCLLQHVATEELKSDPTVGYVAPNQQERHQPRTEYNEEINNEDAQPNIQKLGRESSTDIYPNYEDGISDGNQDKQIKGDEKSQDEHPNIYKLEKESNTNIYQDFEIGVSNGNQDIKIKDGEESQDVKDEQDKINVTTIYLAGYDDQILQLMNDIQKHGQGQELLVYFYLYSNLSYLNLGYFYTDKKILQENIIKYTHYFCVDDNFTRSTWCLDNLSLTNPIDSKARVLIIQEMTTKPTLNDYIVLSDSTLAKDKVELRMPKTHTEEHTHGLYEFILPKENDISLKDMYIDLLKSKPSNLSSSFQNEFMKVNNLESKTQQKDDIPNNYITVIRNINSFDSQQQPFNLKNILEDSVTKLTDPSIGQDNLVSQLRIPYSEEDILNINNYTMYGLYANGSKKYPERHDDIIYLYAEKPKIFSMKNETDNVQIEPVILNDTEILFPNLYLKSISNSQDSKIAIVPHIEGKYEAETKSNDLQNDSYLTTNFNDPDMHLFNDKIGLPYILDGTRGLATLNTHLPEHTLTDINVVDASDNKNLNEQNRGTYPRKESIENSLQNYTEISVEVNEDDMLQDISTSPAENAYLNKIEEEPIAYLTLMQPNFIYKPTMPLNQAGTVGETDKISFPGSVKGAKSQLPINKINYNSNYFNFPNTEYQEDPSTYAQSYDTYAQPHTHKTQRHKSTFLPRHWPFLRPRNLNRNTNILSSENYIPNLNSSFFLPKLCNNTFKQNPVNNFTENPELIDISPTPYHTSSQLSELFLENALPTSSIFQLKSKAPQRSHLHPHYIFNIPSSNQQLSQPKFEQMNQIGKLPYNKENILQQTQILSPSKLIPDQEKFAQNSLPTPLPLSVDYTHNFSPIAAKPDLEISINAESIKPLPSYQINIPFNLNKENIYAPEDQNLYTTGNLHPLEQEGKYSYGPPNGKIQYISPILSALEASYLPVKNKILLNLFSPNIYSTRTTQLPTSYLTPLTQPFHKYTLPDKKIQNISPTLSNTAYTQLQDKTFYSVAPSMSVTQKLMHTSQLPTSYSIPPQSFYKNIPFNSSMQLISPTVFNPEDTYRIPIGDTSTHSSSLNIISPKPTDTIKVPMSYSLPMAAQVYKYLPLYENKQNISPTLLSSGNAYTLNVPDIKSSSASKNIYPIPSHIHTTLPTTYTKPMQPINKHIPSTEKVQNISPTLLGSRDSNALPVPVKTSFSFLPNLYPLAKNIHSAEEPTSSSKSVATQPTNKFIPSDEKLQIITPTLQGYINANAHLVPHKTSYSFLPNIHPSSKHIHAAEEPTSYSKPWPMQPTNKHIPPAEVVHNISPFFLVSEDAYAHPAPDKTSYSFLPNIYPSLKRIQVTDEPLSNNEPTAKQRSYKYIPLDNKIQNISQTLFESGGTYTLPVPESSVTVLPNIYASPKLFHTTEEPTSNLKPLAMQCTKKLIPSGQKLQNLSPSLFNPDDAQGFPDQIISDKTSCSLSSNKYPPTKLKQTTQVRESHLKPFTMQFFDLLTNGNKQNISSALLSSEDVNSLSVRDKSPHSSLTNTSPTFGTYNIESPESLGVVPFTTAKFRSAHASPVLNLSTHQNIIAKLTPSPTQFYNINSGSSKTSFTDRDINGDFSNFIPPELQYITPAGSYSNQFNTMPHISGALPNSEIQKPLLSHLSSDLGYPPHVGTSKTIFEATPPKQAISLEPYLSPLHTTKSLVSTKNNINNPKMGSIDNFSSISPFLLNQMDILSPLPKYTVSWANLRNNHSFKSPYTSKISGNSNVPVKSSVIHPSSIPATLEVPVTYLPLLSTGYIPYNTLLQKNLIPRSEPVTVSQVSDITSTKKPSYIFLNSHTPISKFDERIPFLTQAYESSTTPNLSLDMPKDASTNIECSLYQDPAFSKLYFPRNVTPNPNLNRQLNNNATKKIVADHPYIETTIPVITQQSNPGINQLKYYLNKLITQPILNDILNKKSISIPLDNIGLAKYEPLKLENADFIRTDNPDIDLKVWPGSIKILKVKLVLKCDEMNALNFIPILKKPDYTQDRVDTVVQDFVTRSYGKPVIIKAVRNSNESNEFVVNFNDDCVQNNMIYVLWPTLCKCGCNLNGCRCSFN